MPVGNEEFSDLDGDVPFAVAPVPENRLSTSAARRALKPPNLYHELAIQERNETENVIRRI